MSIYNATVRAFVSLAVCSNDKLRIAFGTNSFGHVRNGEDGGIKVLMPRYNYRIPLSLSSSRRFSLAAVSVFVPPPTDRPSQHSSLLRSFPVNPLPTRAAAAPVYRCPPSLSSALPFRDEWSQLPDDRVFRRKGTALLVGGAPSTNRNESSLARSAPWASGAPAPGASSPCNRSTIYWWEIYLTLRLESAVPLPITCPALSTPCPAAAFYRPPLATDISLPLVRYLLSRSRRVSSCLSLFQLPPAFAVAFSANNERCDPTGYIGG